MSSPLTFVFLGQLFSWALTGQGVGDRMENLRGPRDSGIPAHSVVDASEKPVIAPALPPDAKPQAGVLVGVYLPQQTQGKATGQLRPFFTFDANRWPLTFNLHNARLKAEGGKSVQIDDWVTYVATSRFTAKQSGLHSFVLTLRTPAEAMGCYLYLVVGEVEVFPDFERKIRKKVPPRIVMNAGQRRTFQRDMTLPAGSYQVDLTASCHPSGKPEPRMLSTVAPAWQATEITMQLKGPADNAPRAFAADELVFLREP